MMTEKVDWLLSALTDAVRQRLDKITDEELENATAAIQKRLYDEIDKIALSMLAEYDLRNHGDQIVITVKKRAG